MNKYKARIIPLLIVALVGVWVSGALAANKHNITGQDGETAAKLAIEYAKAEVPFKLGGQVTVEAFAADSGADTGIDASGLVVNVFRKVLGAVSFAGGGGEDPIFLQDVSSSTLFAWNTVPVGLNDLRPGDLIFFKASSGKVNGVAIFLEQKGNLVHFVVPSASKGKVIETFLNVKNDYWQERFAGAGRLTYWQ